MTRNSDEAMLSASPLRAPGTELHWRDDGARRALILKDRTLGRYHRVSTGSAWVWLLCDGRRTVASIAERIAAKGGPTDEKNVISIVRHLAGRRFVQGVPVDVRPPRPHARGFGAACRRVLTWRVTFSRVDPLMTWLYCHIGYLAFKRTARLLAIALMTSGLVAFLVALPSTPNPFAPLLGPRGWYFPFFLFACVMQHEMAHAMTTKHFAREIIGLGFGWFWLGPLFYVDTSDMWLGSRKERILVSLAGAASDLTIAGACSLIALFTESPVSSWAFAIAATLYWLVLGNMSPLLEFDGYYVLADLLDRPDLRRQSLNWLWGRSAWRSMTWDAIRQHRIEFLYGVGSLIYAACLLIVGAHFNYAFFGGILGRAAGDMAAALTWLVTLLLMLILSFALINDVQRLRNSSSSGNDLR